MRITFVLPHAGIAGGIRVCAIYADALRRRGHRVFVASTPLPLRRRLKNAWSRRPQGHFDGSGVSHHVIDRLRPIVDSDLPDADVVVATWWETAEWVAKLDARKGAKVHFIQHDERVIDHRTERVAATWRLPFHRIVIADWLVELGRKEFGVERMALVPNGVDTQLFHAPARDRQPRPTFGCIYSSAHFKGCDVALRAFREVARKISDLQLVVFGERPTGTASAWPADTRFVERPPQDSLRELYAACDAWIVASRSEGFGLPILEAMACRTPVIATPVGAAPLLVASGGGWLVRPDDPHDLADAIVRTAELDARAWRSASDAALATARVNTWQRSTELFEAALEEAGAKPN